MRVHSLYMHLPITTYFLDKHHQTANVYFIYFRYKCLTSHTWPTFRGNDLDGTKAIIKSLHFENDVAYGKSKIFIRSPQTLFQLEEAREKMIPGIVVFLQKVIDFCGNKTVAMEVLDHQAEMLKILITH